MIQYYIIITLFIILAGYFAGTETAVISADKLKLKATRNSNKKLQKKAAAALAFISNSKRTLSTLLVGTNISIVAATSLTTMLFIRRFGQAGEYYATVFMSVIILIFGEILPKAIFRKIANQVLLSTIFILKFFTVLFHPLIKFILFIIYLIPGFRQFEKKQNDVFLTREDLKNIFNIGARQGVLKEFDKKIFTGIFNFSSTYVREIMVPLVDIILAENNSRVIDIIKISERFRYSRIPVFEEHVYNIIGYINILDLVNAKAQDSINKFIRKPYFIPETKKIDELFLEMNKNRIPIVIIVDEYGGASGMVSIEDLVEEIIGDIDQKPQEIEKEQIKMLQNNKWEISGDLNIDDINEQLELSLPKKGFETIAGFIEYYLGRIPKKNESFIYNKYKFLMSSVSATSIIKVKIEKTEKQ